MAEDQLADYRRRMEAKRGGRPAPAAAPPAPVVRPAESQPQASAPLVFGGSDFQREGRRPLLGRPQESCLPQTDDTCLGFNTQTLVLGIAAGLVCAIVCLLLATVLMDS